MKIAMIGSSHWHSPLYLNAALKQGHEIVLFDPDTSRTAEQARQYHVTCTKSLDDLFAADIGFAIVLGKHAEMPAYIAKTIEAGIPFLAEKPAGLDASVVRELADRCAAKGLFNAAAFSMRWDRAMNRIKDLIDSGRLGRIARVGVSYFAGPKSRYPAHGCPWVIEKEVAGGGALMNVGTHVIDLLRYWGFDLQYVSGSASWELTKGSVEDVATLLLRIGPAVCFVESGYLVKNPYDGAHITIFAEHANVEYRRHVLTVQWEDGTEERLKNTHPEPRDDMLKDLIAKADQGTPAPAALHDIAAMLEICNKFYRDLDRI
jgi:predicted dehydrogenase